MKWFQFSLRDIFWLTMCCALATAWWADHDRMARSAMQFIDAAMSQQEEMAVTITALRYQNDELQTDIPSLMEAARVGTAARIQFTSFQTAVVREFGEKGLSLIERWGEQPCDDPVLQRLREDGVRDNRNEVIEAKAFVCVWKAGTETRNVQFVKDSVKGVRVQRVSDSGKALCVWTAHAHETRVSSLEKILSRPDLIEVYPDTSSSVK